MHHAPCKHASTCKYQACTGLELAPSDQYRPSNGIVSYIICNLRITFLTLGSLRGRFLVNGFLKIKECMYNAHILSCKSFLYNLSAYNSTNNLMIHKGK